MRTYPWLQWLGALAAAVFLLPAPAPAREPQPQRLLLDDFEGDVKDRWQHIVASTEQVKSGQSSGKWADKLVDAVNLKLLHDWSPYRERKLTFWCYSEKATDGRFVVVLGSDDPKDDTTDLYYTLIPVDWTGWKEFRLSLAAFKTWGQPLGWHQIDAVTFSFEFHWVGSKQPSIPGTALYFDDLCLEE